MFTNIKSWLDAYDLCWMNGRVVRRAMSETVGWESSRELSFKRNESDASSEVSIRERVETSFHVHELRVTRPKIFGTSPSLFCKVKAFGSFVLTFAQSFDLTWVGEIPAM